MVRDTGEAEGQEFLINSKDCSVLGGISKAFFFTFLCNSGFLQDIFNNWLYASEIQKT